MPDLHLPAAVAVAAHPVGLASETVPAPMLPHWVSRILWLLESSNP